MTIPPNRLHASQQIETTRFCRASWLLQLSRQSEAFDELDSDKQESLQKQLRTFLEAGEWPDHLGVGVDEGFTEWWYAKVRDIFSKLRTKKSAHCEKRLVQTHTAAIEESTGTMRVDTSKPPQRLTKEGAIYQVFCTLDGLLRRCARCKQLFIRTGRQRYCKKQCANKARLSRFRKKRPPAD